MNVIKEMKTTATKKDKKRDPERAMRAIIDAAREEFAKFGYDGARTDRIAAKAEMSKGMIYHYFASKDDLFVAVLEKIYAELEEANHSLVLDDVEPEIGVKQLIQHTYGYFAKHPEFIDLVNTENLMRAVHLNESTNAKGLFNPLHKRLEDLVKRGQEQGIFRENVDVVHLYVSIVGLGYFFLSNRWTLSVVFGHGFLGQEVEDYRLEHINDVILSYLRHKG